MLKRESASMQGLPGHAEGCGAAGRVRVLGGEGGKQGWHGDLPVNKARRLVVVGPSWGRLQWPACKRQRVIDGNGLLPKKIILSSGG